MTLGGGLRRALGGAVVCWTIYAGPAHAQSPEPDSRAGAIAAEQSEKAKDLTPSEGNRVEQIISRVEDALIGGRVKWHPFFDSALQGGGFTLGAGYRHHVSAYDSIDFRGSITFSGYKRIEAEFLAPRLFDRRGILSVTGGWREATSVRFGFGTANTSIDDRTNFSFQQPYGSAAFIFRPTRHWLVLGAGVELSQWDQEGSSKAPSVEERYTPDTLPGLGSSPTYVRSSGSIGLDFRAAPGYAKTGGVFGVAFTDFTDTEGDFGFGQVDYTAVQHVPILREVWVLSLRGEVQTTYLKEGQTIPFYMLPSLGGGSNLRGFTSWRFRDRHSMLLSADWRVLANHFLDVAVFMDAGKVVSRTSNLDFDGLKTNYGLGFRIHSPTITALRIDLAKSNEGFQFVFSSKAAF